MLITCLMINDESLDLPELVEIVSPEAPRSCGGTESVDDLYGSPLIPATEPTASFRSAGGEFIERGTALVAFDPFCWADAAHCLEISESVSSFYGPAVFAGVLTI